MLNQERSKVIDTEFLRSIIENDIEFEKELFAIFSENAARNITKMKISIKELDNNSWYMAAHAFKGAAASIGAFKLSGILEYAQTNPEESADKKTEILIQAKEELDRVLRFISKEL